jgi:hypothetical protein
MRPGAAAGLACFLFLAAISPGDGARADDPSRLPDLSIEPQDISFSFYNDLLDYGLVGYPIDIGVLVHNSGPGNSSSANVSLFIDGGFFAIMHIMKNLTTEYPGNLSTVHFTWDTTGAASGNHTIRAVANDTAGDAAPGDNAAETVFRLYKNIPAVSMSLSPSSIEAVVTPTDNATVRFNGSVLVDLGEWGEAALYLFPSVDQGWAVSVSPPYLIFAGSEWQSFCVTAVVPAASTSMETAALKVDGFLRAGTMTSTARTQAIITVRPYYNVSAESETPQKDIGIDAVTVLTVKVHNLGNSVDSYAVKVENLDQLKADGWEVIVGSDSMPRVPTGEYRTLKITVRAPEDTTIYENNVGTIKLKFSSINAANRGENVSASYSLVVRERGYNTPCLAGSIAVAAVVIVAAAAVAVLKRRGRPKQKTVNDYMKELNLERGE